MKIKTKYNLIYFPVAILAFPPGIILWLLEKLAEWYGELLMNYKDWCEYKSKMVIRDNNGKLVYNPQYLEERRE